MTSFITDWMLLVKDFNCKYVAEDRKVRDQFVFGVSDEQLNKTLLEHKKYSLTNWGYIN